jgi:hypothetical protein
VSFGWFVFIAEISQQQSIRIDREHGGDRRSNGLCAQARPSSDLIERIGPNQCERRPAK